MFLDIFSSHLIVITPSDAIFRERLGRRHTSGAIPRVEYRVLGDTHGEGRLERSHGTKVTLDSELQVRNGAAASSQEDVLLGRKWNYCYIDSVAVEGKCLPSRQRTAWRDDVR